MVLIEVTSTVRPDGRERALAAMRVMGEATRKEPGCLHYRFYNDVEDPNVFFVYN
jgi:quinol monooxygenase YgiN